VFALGRFVGRLHRIRTHGFGFFDIRPLVEGKDPSRVWGACPTWRHYVLCRLEAHVERCAQIGAVSRGEARRIFTAFAAADELLDDVSPCLLHGDLGSHNVFVEDGAVTALIDWEDCLSGDPAFDVAFWATFHPDRRHRAFLDGYRLERELPDDFERRFWLYYLRVALSKTVLRHRLGLVDLPGREPAARRIQKGLERFETAGGRRPLAA
jgi:fructosamine-3-kinase